MNKKYLPVCGSAGLGLLLAAVNWCCGAGQGAEIFSAPLALAGEGLRALSLSGTAGNFLAWTLLLLAALSPAALLAWRSAHRAGEKVRPADFLLYLAVPVLLAALWWAANPSGDFLEGMRGAAALGTAAALVLAWGVLELLAQARSGEGEALARLFRLLFLVCAVLTAFAGTVNALSVLLAGVDGAELLELAVLGARTALDLVPVLLTALTLTWGAELAAALAGTAFTQETVELCRRTAGGCVRVVQWTVLCAVCANLLQLALLGQLSSSQFSVDFPIFSLALALGMLLLCRCLERGKQLQDDNDSII